MSTINRGVLANDGLKCLLAGQTAVSMVTGVVVDSFLIKASHPGGYRGKTAFQTGKSVHGLRLMPFDQPWRRETTMLGAVFDVTTINSVCMKDDGVEFLTRSTMPAMGAPLVPSRNKCTLYLS